MFPTDASEAQSAYFIRINDRSMLVVWTCLNV